MIKTIASAKWYHDVCAMDTVTINEQVPAVFLSLGKRNHDIALFQSPPNRNLGHHDIGHVSTEIGGDLNNLKDFHASLVQKHVEVIGVKDDGISYGVFSLDPDGHHQEVFVSTRQTRSQHRFSCE